MPPLVSVVMPVYNQERYVRAAVDSILQQTFTNFELIVVDDGSTDGTRSILGALTDPRVRVVASSHVGFSGALERGVRESAAPWIARMDSDDLAHPHRLQRQMQLIAANEDVAFVSCVYGIVTPNDKFLAPKKAGPDRRLTKVDITLSTALFADPGTTFHRQTALDVGVSEPDFGYSEKALWYKLLERGAGVLLGEPLHFIRWRVGSLSRSNFQQSSDVHVAVRRRYDPENARALAPVPPTDTRTGTLKAAWRAVDYYLLAGDVAAARELAGQVWRKWPLQARAMKLLAKAAIRRRALKPWVPNDAHPDFFPIDQPW